MECFIRTAIMSFDCVAKRQAPPNCSFLARSVFMSCLCDDMCCFCYARLKRDYMFVCFHRFCFYIYLVSFSSLVQPCFLLVKRCLTSGVALYNVAGCELHFQATVYRRTVGQQRRHNYMVVLLTKLMMNALTTVELMRQYLLLMIITTMLRMYMRP